MPRPATHAVAIAIAIGIAAGAATPARASELVIPPGQESAIGAMTGLGEGTRVGGCTMQSAAVNKDHVDVTYACGAGGTVTVVLQHPDAATGAVLARTEQFALVKGDGAAPPPALVRELEARIRAAEGDWEWQRVEPKRDEPRPADPSEAAPPPGEHEAGPPELEPDTGGASSMSSAWGVAAALVVGAALALLLGRRRRDV